MPAPIGFFLHLDFQSLGQYLFFRYPAKFLASTLEALLCPILLFDATKHQEVIMKPAPALLIVISVMCAALTIPAFGQEVKGQSPDSPTDTIEICLRFGDGWQLVSNPVRRVPGADSIREVFCGAARCPFSWRGGYLQDCSASNGRGFWIKTLPPPYFCCIAGEQIVQDSFGVVTGWNLIGSISYPVAVASILSIPPNIISSRYFKFSSGYSGADTLYPGEGYWVKANGAGRIVLSSGF